MKKSKIEIIKLTSKEILLNLLDISAIGIEALFHRDRDLVREIRLFKKQREIDKVNYQHKIWRLQKTGFVEKYIDHKKTSYKLTEKGTIRTFRYISKKLTIAKPKVWDRLWRIVIFDIPEEKKYFRDLLRLKLKQLDFYQLQKSVWIYPYDCRDIIEIIKRMYNLKRYILYITAKDVETDIDLVEYFLDNKILHTKTKFKT